jgi:2-octaprenyl-6-methoxyphenol hydroxylase
MLQDTAGSEDVTDRFDLIVAGGGMVGASLARALAGCGMRVAVIEARPLDSADQPSYDDRAIALAHGSRMILQGLGVWPALVDEVEPIRRIHVSERGGFGFTRLDHRSQEVEALGYVVTARALGRALLLGLDELPGVELLCPAELQSFEITTRCVQVRVAVDGGMRTLQAGLLVAADGTNSLVRQQLGIEQKVWDYAQTAVISNLTPGTPPRGTAYERFTDSGPLAMLPLKGERCALVWTVRNDDVEQVMTLPEREFLQRVQERFGYRLGKFTRAGRRASYPLKLVRAREHVRPRVALIGNAAHAVHPVTGQGFNLGLRDVAVLADVLHDARRQGGDLGALALLTAYADWRRQDQQTVALITDGLVRLFTNPLLPLRLARNLGLLALDVLPPAKRLLTRGFMGSNGRLPRLSRGLSLG